MTDSRPLPTGEPLLAGVAHEVDDHHAEGIQPPTEDGPREVDYDLPIVISSDEEEDSVVIVIEDGDDEEDYRSDEEEESEEEHWTSEDSGYDTLSEEEEDLEDDDVNIGRLSPLIQEFPPEEFWHGWRQEFSPFPADVAHPHVPDERLPPVLPLAGPCSSVAEPSRPEDPAASTSGHSSSTKRSREESHSEQVKLAIPDKVVTGGAVEAGALPPRPRPDFQTRQKDG
ncbi:proline-, glutamic acid- and leucine-rich protein 1-like [Seriola aureovittata]|uniref:proline-, glutamic acid- and leucine-rich protein 1-like n=1 Tax=Seriola aureovittata TaxID=2871759 RepID=UPI0024BEE911|nr:proline-, glutamic acid- and leucine-rich protein 1-like [Seriola aureovittata]